MQGWLKSSVGEVPNTDAPGEVESGVPNQTGARKIVGKLFGCIEATIEEPLVS